MNEKTDQLDNVHNIAMQSYSDTRFSYGTGNIDLTGIELPTFGLHNIDISALDLPDFSTDFGSFGSDILKEQSIFLNSIWKNFLPTKETPAIA